MERQHAAVEQDRRVRPASSPSQAPDVRGSHHLQRMVGNQGIGMLAERMRAGGMIVQAKLTIGAPGDRYEQEADRVADQVTSGGAASAFLSDGGGPVRRACSACAGGAAPCPDCEEEKVQRMPAPPTITPIVQRETDSEQNPEEEEEEVVQSKETAGVVPAMTSRQEGMISSLRGGGNPLAADVRQFMEPRFGRDFGTVRVHTDDRAAESAKSIGALAYTIGRDVVFGAGRYNPESIEGKRLLAHELTHVVQQGASSGGHGRNGVIQRTEEDLNQLHASDRLDLDESLDRVATPNPTAAAPPAPLAPPGAASFAPLTGPALTDRQAHGMSTDSGPMIGEIETVLIPTGGANPPCTPIPANFETTVATELSTVLTGDIPTLAPTAAPDPMAIAAASADVAMPIINSHYSPHAPSVTPASFMARVSRKPVNYADPIRNNDDSLAEFLEWYAGSRTTLRTLTSDKCGMGRAWWVGFAGWLGAAGASWDAAPHSIRERAALYDTYRTSVTQGGRIQFGLAFRLGIIPHTVTHEAMHLFQHADLRAQVGRLPNLRSSRDIITEGFAEYLARGVRDQVVTALQARVPPVLSPAEEATARTASAYPNYFDRAVQIRDVLYRHGQDGEEAIRRAFFLGEGWRFGLLENAAGEGSPIESDRAVPAPVDIHFSLNAATPNDPALLAPITAYLTTRSIARVAIVGRTDATGNPADNVTLGQQRADAVQAQLVADGVPAARITTSSRGGSDQIPGGNSVNRRATVTVTDSRNEFPGLPGPGRP